MRYRTVPRTAEAVQFDGHNTGALQDLLGDAGTVASNGDGTASVYAQGREERRLLCGWWVSVDEDGAVTTHSGEAFQRLWEPA